MASDLLDHLRPWYDESFADDSVMTKKGRANWPKGFGFGKPIRDLFSIVVHFTVGYGRRDAAKEYIKQFIVKNHPKWGRGPQLYISGDGTVAKLIELPRRTGHATFVNNRALGVETGNRGDKEPPPNKQWLPASSDPNDIPGAKLWITSAENAQTEVLPAWWTTKAYSGPSRDAVGAGHMLFSEWQYRAWALLARYLLEEFGVPRNFPLLPHIRRDKIVTNSVPFRRIVLADECAEMMMRLFERDPIKITPSNFAATKTAELQKEYAAAVRPAGGRFIKHNQAWAAFFQLYRGMHGHGFSGNINKGLQDHDCPGPLFDFHRLAREVWDWWWYPFDADAQTTALPHRNYRHFDENTPLLEYYFDESEPLHTQHLTEGIHGSSSSPATFSLNPHSPIYALANGELIAARFPAESSGVSLAFALVRHEIYYRPAVNFGNLFPGRFGTRTGTISYDSEPSYVYSLYMHLGRPSGMSFDQVTNNNPDWLNRLLIRKKECNLGVKFYDDDPKHHNISNKVWNNRPPGSTWRPTTVESWRIDGAFLNTFLETLRSGGTAGVWLGAEGKPIKILLGDFLGESGIIRHSGGVDTHGIRVEIFTPQWLPPGFTVQSSKDWTPPPNITSPFVLIYYSEWAREPTGAEADRLRGIGVDLSLLNWWKQVSYVTRVDISTPRLAQLPEDGSLVHFDPFVFMRWINQKTWEHEWSKYKVTDAAGKPVTPTPVRPRSRRV